MRVSIQAVKVRTVRSEKNDCAVFAIMSAAGVPYAQAHQALKSVGRIKGEGTHDSMIVGALRALGLSPVLYDICTKATLSRVLKTHQKGRFIVMTKNHAMGLRDGMLFDNVQTHGKSYVQRIISLDGGL